MHRLQYILLLVLMLFMPCTNAQNTYQLKWGKEALLLGTGTVNAFAASAIDLPTAPLTLTEVAALRREDVNWFDRGATYQYSPSAAAASDWLIGGLAAAPLLLLLDNNAQGNRNAIGISYLETMLFTLFLPSYAKGSVQRLRPLVYNPDLGLQEKNNLDPRRSFFSGHTANAFAAAVFFATVYADLHPGSGRRGYVLGGALSLAAAVGYFRYAAGAHYPSDILTGAVAGSIAGYLLPLLHRVGEQENNGANTATPARPFFSIRLSL